MDRDERAVVSAAPAQAAMRPFSSDEGAPDPAKAMRDHYALRQRYTLLYGLGVLPGIVLALMLYGWLGGFDSHGLARLVIWIMLPMPLAVGLGLELRLRSKLARALGRRVPGRALTAASAEVARARQAPGGGNDMADLYANTLADAMAEYDRTRPRRRPRSRR